MDSSRLHRAFKAACTAALVTAMAMAFAPDGWALRNVKKVSAIEFQGLKYLTRHEIVGAVGARAERDGIIIDVDGLHAFLRTSAYVKSYKLREERARLVITVIENEPVFILVVKKSGVIIPFEFDDRMRVLSVKEPRAFDKPVVTVSQDEVNGSELSRRLKNLLGILIGMNSSRLPLYREIDEIDLSRGPAARIRLRGRRTEFIVEADRLHLNALNHIAGYLDGTRHYPDQIVYCGNSAVMK